MGSLCKVSVTQPTVVTQRAGSCLTTRDLRLPLAVKQLDDRLHVSAAGQHVHDPGLPRTLPLWCPWMVSPGVVQTAQDPSMHTSTEAQPSHSISKRCLARIGLLGNPSDGYGGCTISLSLANFWADVTLEPSPVISFRHHPVHDAGAFTSLGDLTGHVDKCGLGSGVQLLQMLCVVFWRHCERHGISLQHQPHNFTLSWDTNIPRQSGLAGSSAIVTAGLRCLMEWYGLGVAHIPLHVQPSLVLEAEGVLGITAGLQDRVIQVYGGLVYMDFSRVEAQGYGDYTPMNPALLPPLYLIWGDFSSSSGKVHSTVKQRWRDGDQEVHKAMEDIAQCARQGRSALESRDVHQLAQLMDTNFSLRRQVFGDEAVGEHNLRMVEVARSVGASAKLPGSGGAVVALCPEGEEQEKALQQACERAGFRVVRVEVGPPSGHVAEE